MSRKNIRLYLRAFQHVFQTINPCKFFKGLLGSFVLFDAEKQIYSGVVPDAPKEVLVKDLNQIDIRLYTYHSSKNILRKGKVL